jgi:hypothetical protein
MIPVGNVAGGRSPWLILVTLPGFLAPPTLQRNKKDAPYRRDGFSLSRGVKQLSPEN